MSPSLYWGEGRALPAHPLMEGVDKHLLSYILGELRESNQLPRRKKMPYDESWCDDDEDLDDFDDTENEDDEDLYI